MMTTTELTTILESRILACDRRLDVLRDNDAKVMELAMTAGRRLAYQDMLGTISQTSTLGTLTLIFTEQGRGYVEERRVSTQYQGDPIPAAQRVLESYAGYRVQIVSVEDADPFSRLVFRDMDSGDLVTCHAIISTPRMSDIQAIPTLEASIA